MNDDTLNFAELKTAGILPSPQGVALTIMKLCQTENVALPELAHIVQGDPVLAGRIIKIANIVNPNKSRPIASISIDTLILIGIHAVRQVVLGFSLITSYHEGACNAFDYHRYWSRSVAMASLAQALAAILRVAPPAEMFTCGLLADIGRLGLAAARPNAYSDLLLQMPSASDGDLAKAEIERFGMSHNELSARMLLDWGIPKLYIDAVFFHEAAASSGFSEGSRQQKLICTLELASVIADAYLEKSDTARAALMQQALGLGAALGLEAAQVVNAANQTLAEWYEWGSLLNIKTERVAPFEIPENAPDAAATAPAEAEKPQQPAGQPLRILLVDADAVLLTSVSQELDAGGHAVFAARTSRQAFDIAVREQPHVIIADWMVPETGGVSLCRRIREQPWGQQIYFIMLTTLDDDLHQIESFEAGADACIRKPFPGRLLNSRLLAAQRRFETS